MGTFSDGAVGVSRDLEPVALRPLGSSGLESGALAFGGNVFGWTVDEKTAHGLLDAFVDAGFNLIDTADTYGPRGSSREAGASERILGSWLAQPGRRKRVLVATKVGRDYSPTRKGLSRSAILSGVEGSLRRLGIDSIDLYQAHIDDPETPLEETLAAFTELLRQGKVRAIGASNFSSERLTKAGILSKVLGLSPYTVLQPKYNLYDRQPFESQLAPLAADLGLGVITYSSLAGGFLSGKYRSAGDLGKSPRGERAASYLDPRGSRILGALDRVGESLGASPAQVALAWLIRRPGVSAAIVSATSRAQLAEIIVSARLALDSASLTLLDQASA